MIRKLVMGLALAMLAGSGMQAQQNQTQPSQTQQDQTQPNQPQQDQAQPNQTQPAPEQAPAAGQAPATQSSSSSQEAADDEYGRRRAKEKQYKNWTYNVNAGSNLTRATTKTFVKGGGILGGGGVARNFSQYFAFRLDFQFVDLPLRSSALQLAQAPSASSHVYALTLDPQFSLPVTKRYTAYLLAGPSFLRRAGKLSSSTAVPGTACNAFYDWWGPCFNLSLPLSGDFLKESQNEIGYNFGGGAARKMSNGHEIFAEYRQQHGSHGGRTTDWRSVVVGLRW
jgi:opacity protein-like surface antigen